MVDTRIPTRSAAAVSPESGAVQALPLSGAVSKPRFRGRRRTPILLAGLTLGAAAALAVGLSGDFAGPVPGYSDVIRKDPTTLASEGIGPSVVRSLMADWNSAKAGDSDKGFPSPSSTATWRKLTPSSRRKQA